MTRNPKRGRTQNRLLFALWTLSFIPVAVLISVPTSTGGQAFLGIFAIVVVAVLKPFTTVNMVARFALLATVGGDGGSRRRSRGRVRRRPCAKPRFSGPHRGLFPRRH